LAGKVVIHKNRDVRQHETTRLTCGANGSFVEMLIRACSGCSLFSREARDSRSAEETRLKSPNLQSKHARDHKAGLRFSIS
jgi:hypothetical protein